MKDASSQKALKSGVWYTIANFVTKGISFLTMPIFTRLMTKGEIGDFSNFTSWLAIMTSVISLDLYTSVTLAKFDFKDKLNEYISSVLVLGSSVTIVVFLCSLAFKERLIQLLSLNELEYYLLFLLPLLSPSLQMLQTKNRLEYKYKFSVSVSLGESFFQTVFGLVCVLTFRNKLIGRLIGSYSVSILLYAAIYLSFMIRCHKVNPQYWKYAVKISLPMVIHVLSGHLLSSSDRIMITNICGREDNALYSVAYACSMIVSILWMSMNTAWSPWAYEQMNHQNYAALKKASRPYLLFYGAVVFCFLLIAPDLLMLMGGSSYLPALAVIPPVILAFVFQFVYSLYVNIETFCKKQRFIAMGTAIAAILNVILNFLFIPIFGYVAAAYTTLAGYVVLFGIHFFLINRMGKAGWYDSRFNLVFLSVFLVVMPATQVLYRHSILRYSIIGVLFVSGIAAVIWLRRELLEMIRSRSVQPVTNKLKSTVARLFHGKK